MYVQLYLIKPITRLRNSVSFPETPSMDLLQAWRELPVMRIWTWGVIELQSGIVAIEAYLKFVLVVSL